MYATAKSLYQLEFGEMGAVKEKTSVLTFLENITSFDFDWKRNWIYWTNGSGQVKRARAKEDDAELIPTSFPGKGFFCFIRGGWVYIAFYFYLCIEVELLIDFWCLLS